jgi:hypothetical protein
LRQIKKQKRPYMKTTINQLVALSLLFAAVSCKKDEPTTPTPTSADTAVVLSGSLPTTTLDASKKYLLKGQVFVNSNAVLTIPAGTVIMGDKATKGTLIINTGGKIMAEGTAARPIVFTSQNAAGARDKGDWGGVIILGRANVNQNAPTIEGISPAVSYGTFQSTASNTESSGVLKYVRIEYAGIALSPNNETNSLTLGGVGGGTIIENVQVSFGGDDGFEWFGGVASAKNIVSYAMWDDDFDTDFGWSGNVQFALSIRDPFAADQSGSNAFESDNDANGNDVMPYTSGVFSNVTVLGPAYDSSKSISGNYQRAMHIRRRSALSLYNSVIAGFPTGVMVDGASTEAQYTTNSNGALKNNLVAVLYKGTTAPDTVKAGSGNTAASVYAYWIANGNDAFRPYTQTKNNAGYTAAGIDATLFFGKNSSYPADPDFGTLGVNGASATGASFIDARVSGSFFTPTAYRGAFGGTDWTNGWANFNPQNTTY